VFFFCNNSTLNIMAKLYFSFLFSITAIFKHDASSPK
jgi:hypothetical protein